MWGWWDWTGFAVGLAFTLFMLIGPIILLTLSLI